MTAFAGRFGGTRDVAAALRPDGPAATLDEGPLALAWSPPGNAPGGTERTLCLIDGRLDPGAVARGYERDGASVLGELRGEWALVLWDREQRRGLIARDRLGMRGLFVHASGRELLFASEVRNLLALLPTRPPPDRVAAGRWLERVSGRDDRTLYEGIRRMPPAGAIELLPDGTTRPFRHWRPRYHEPPPRTADDAAAQVREGVAHAVERALDGARQPALMLSGGLDSSTVAALAPRALPTYSRVFPDEPAVDEAERIAATRAALGLTGVDMPFEQSGALAAQEQFIQAWELPSVSPNRFVWAPLLQRAKADGVDVLLDGEGGDELFGCARYLIADHVRSGRPGAARATARRLPGMGDHPDPRWVRRALAVYGLRGALPAPVHAALRSARRRDRQTGLGEWEWKRLDGPRWWAHLADSLTTDALGAGDQQRRDAALAGLELRHPLRDPDLIELALHLPPELSFDPHADRPLVRRALAGRIPVDDDAKPAFNALLDRAFAGPDAPLLRELLGDRAKANASSLDLFRAASLELWLRHQNG